jgi:hypothetical protein
MPNRTPALVALAAILLLLIAVVAGCGSDDETTTAAEPTTATTSAEGGDSTATTSTEAANGDGAEPALDPHIAAEQAIVAFFTSPNTEKVCAGLSPPLLSETYGSLAGCRNGRPPESLADGVAIDDMEVDGDVVTATATPKGGTYDGTEVEMTVSVHGADHLISGIEADVPVGP